MEHLLLSLILSVIVCYTTENANALKLAYKEFEPKEGADTTLSPIIFTHGITNLKEYWYNIPQVIADGTRRKAYTYDARNHGDSEYTEEFSFDLNVDDLFHFMDTINVSKAILVGHSMGGTSSIKAALQKPELFEVVIIEEMFAKKIPQEIMNPICDFVKLWIASVNNVPKDLSPTEATAFAVDYMLSQLPENARNPAMKIKLNKLMKDLRRTPEGGYDVKYNKAVIMREMQNMDKTMSEYSGQYNGPSYFIYGDMSPFQVGKEEESIKSHFPKAEFTKFEGAGHDLHMVFPEKFSENVVKILTQ